MNNPYVDLRDAQPLPSNLVLRSVGRRFADLDVLRDLNLTLLGGEAVAVIGRSGCGKSTLLRLLANLDSPSEGSIELGGRPLAASDQRIRLMFQDARLLPWKTVLGNVLLGGHEFNQARYALDEVDLWDKARQWPATLSGGQRQRVSLARALAHQPDLLLLDEPFSALDALTRMSMHVLIERLWREHGFTLVMVTHDVSEAVTLADRVILLEDGGVAMDLRIDLPRPRVPTDPRFVQYEERLLQRLTGDTHPGRAPVEPPASSPASSQPFLKLAL